MRIAVPMETAPGETRVALTPDAAGKLIKAGHSVAVQEEAGLAASFTDASYREAGAEVTGSGSLMEGARVVARVGPPLRREGGLDEIAELPAGSILIGLLDPHRNGDILQRLAESGVTALAMELMPRITRAQSMDALSAMSTVTGYKAALLGADTSVKFFPMMMTAAGTIAPAKVFVLGAGVAGLQAIATARRLGAKVEAFDIRPAAREQVESLGASFVAAEEVKEEAETEGGYAREVSEEERAREQEVIAEHVAASDVVITTALVPGGPAPRLLTRAMVEGMAPGSVVVDMAAPAGGNCEVTSPGETVVHAGVKIHGPLNLAASLPFHASQMYARTVVTLLGHLAPEGEATLDLEDEITSAICVVHDGQVRFQP
ncbi:MAG: Re/Si-specific NAD(P)(+) transhydrogenase subunit alpha [Candidatus Palauibacterales bacterium]|nr:Re/Si-specific NAD(P)(+) transhydrogenase subunit alpha [Candidatus Palauibacterales bacterium]